MEKRCHDFMSVVNKKIFLVIILGVILLFLITFIDHEEYFSLKSIQDKAANLKKQAHSNYITGILIFISVYILVNLWFPAAAVLTLLSGYLYGAFLGAVYVIIAATIGAWLAFEISRHLAGNWIQHKWRDQLSGFNKEVSRRGYAYLLSVRFIPMMPYVLINLLAGLTRIRTRTFIWTTALGSLPGVLILSYAGRKFLTLTSVDQIYSPDVILAFLLLIVLLGIVAGFKIIAAKKKNRYKNAGI